MKKVLNKKEVVWRTQYYLDHVGQVFKYNGKVYRLINADKERYVRKLFSDRVISDLIKRGWLVKTKMNEDICFEGEEDRLILEHECVEHVSRSHEWTCKMFLDARSMLAKLNIYLLKKGYELVDPHSANVFFIGCKPVYMDIGSIVPAGEAGLKGWYGFCQIWIYPFLLVQKGKITWKMFRELMFFGTGITYSGMKAMSGGMKTRRLDRMRETVEYRLYDNEKESDRKSVRTAVRFLHRLPAYSESGIKKKKVKKYAKYAVPDPIINEESGYWTDYHDNFTRDGKVKADERFQYYIELIKPLREIEKIHDVFEIAGNSGVMSQLLLENHLIDYACVSDYDAGSIESGYKRCRGNQEISKKIMFSVIDLMDGNEKAYDLKKDRYQSDLVLALAVTHHLILTQKIKLSFIVEVLSQYTRKYLITEFMPLGLWAGDDENCPPVPEWYTLEWFLEGIKEKFNIIKVEQISRNRIVVLGEKADRR